MGFFTSVISIVLIDLVLAGDNAVVIAAVPLLSLLRTKTGIGYRERSLMIQEDYRKQKRVLTGIHYREELCRKPTSVRRQV
jgi:hypothetical protein